MMKRIAILLYGIACYAIGMGSLFYMIGWLGNLLVPKSIDSAPTGPFGQSLAINLALFAAFGLQHSVMARPSFKKWWTRFVPEAAERSTYILLSGVILTVTMLCWQPMGIVVWESTNPLLSGLCNAAYAMGWAILVGSTFALNHFDLFGLRQVWLQFRKRPYTSPQFATPGPYRMVRHPIYVGWITLVWATPSMSLAHLVFAIATTVYIFVAIRFEERDLVAFHGAAYEQYRRRIPMLVPGLLNRQVNPTEQPAAIDQCPQPLTD